MASPRIGRGPERWKSGICVLVSVVGCGRADGSVTGAADASDGA
jgi:hypothetical protein